MGLKLKFKQAELTILHKLSIKVTAKGSDYHYIPVWFKKVDNFRYEILTFDQLPKEVIDELNLQRGMFKLTDQMAAKERPMTPEETRSAIIQPFKK